MLIPDRLGDAWAEVPSLDHREVLTAAFDMLCDEFFAGYQQARRDDKVDLSEFSFGAYLPSRYGVRYTPLFAQRFFLALSTVGWKLAQDDANTLMLVFLAEELALGTLIKAAEVVLEFQGVASGFSEFRDAAFQDIDFEYLFNPQMDGIDQFPASAHLRITRLDFDSWFESFDSAQTAVHPYSAST